MGCGASSSCCAKGGGTLSSPCPACEIRFSQKDPPVSRANPVNEALVKENAKLRAQLATQRHRDCKCQDGKRAQFNTWGVCAWHVSATYVLVGCLFSTPSMLPRHIAEWRKISVGSIKFNQILDAIQEVVNWLGNHPWHENTKGLRFYADLFVAEGNIDDKEGTYLFGKTLGEHLDRAEKSFRRSLK